MIDKNSSNVYFITYKSKELKNTPIKIGVANNVALRLANLQTANPYKLFVIATIPCETESSAYALELCLHKFCETKHGKRLNGEWFIIYSSIPLLINDAFSRMSKNKPYIGSVIYNKNKTKDDTIAKQAKEIERLKKLLHEKDYEISLLNESISKFYETYQ